MAGNHGCMWRRLAVAAVLAVPLLFAAIAPANAQSARKWKPLDQDNIHDPKSPAIERLQPPAEALSRLPPQSAGDFVDWGEAFENGLIKPRSNIHPETKFNLRNTDVLLDKNGSMPMVRFPHRDHTRWLDCINCHNDKLFKKEAEKNRFSMLAILEGEQCGVCHGAVAFPLSECKRCHNTPRATARALAPAQAPLAGR